MYIYEKSIPVTGNNEFTHIDVDIHYRRDFRGYILNVVPVKRDSSRGVVLVTFEPYRNYSRLIHTVSRRSKAGDAVAINKAAEYIEMFVDVLCEKYGMRTGAPV